jgi:hypothetical protein
MRTLDPELPLPGIRVKPASVNNFNRILYISTISNRYGEDEIVGEK